MKNTLSHMHEARRYFGEANGKPFTEWLNRKKETKNIEKLLDAAATFSQNIAAAMESPKGKRLKRSRVVGIFMPDEILGMCHEINSILSEFKLTPVLHPSAETLYGVEGWEVFLDSGTNDVSTAEAFALQSVLELGKEGLLTRVKRCGNSKCNRWFYSRFNTQKFHSSRCQQEAFRSDPEWKRKRRAYMRNLRQLHKRRG
jgi:hypothetical protein